MSVTQFSKLILILLLSVVAFAQPGVKPGACSTAISSVSVNSPPQCVQSTNFLNTKYFNDVVPGPPKLGSILVAIGNPPKWTQLAPATSSNAVLHGGSVPRWQIITVTDLPSSVTNQSLGALPFNTLQYNAGGTTTFTLSGAAIVNGKVTVTHGTSTTLAITGPANGGSYVLEVIQDSTGGGVTLTLGSGCVWKVGGGGAGAVTLSSGANVIDTLAFVFDGTNCIANFRQNYN